MQLSLKELTIIQNGLLALAGTETSQELGMSTKFWIVVGKINEEIKKQEEIHGKATHIEPFSVNIPDY